jgi:hypothetical protein
MFMMVVFGLILSCSIGLLFAAIITFPICNKTLRIILIIPISLIFGFSALNLMIWDIERDKTNWNNGYCLNCGNELAFSNTYSVRSVGKSETVYTYYCNNCGNVVELSNYYLKENS